MREGLGRGVRDAAVRRDVRFRALSAAFYATRWYSAFALIALTALYTLSDAAKNERLNSETYQRLALAMVLFVGSFVVAFGVAGTAFDGRPDERATCAGLCLAFGPAFATSVKTIREHGPGHDETWARVAKDFKEATNFGDRTEKGGYLELFYKLSFWTSLVVGGSFAFSPLSPSPSSTKWNRPRN